MGKHYDARPMNIETWIAGAGGAPAAGAGVDDLWLSQYYECRLRRGDDQVDYLCSIAPSGARCLYDEPAVTDHPRWQPLRKLFKSWNDVNSPLAARVPFLWLEFDDVFGRGTEEILPSVCACLVPYYRCEEPLIPGVRARNKQTALETLRALGMPPSTAEEGLLVECFDRLPPNGRWIHLSVMLGRSPQAIKLYGSLPRICVLPYLESVGWSGELREIETVLKGLYGPDLLGDEVFIDVNLANLRNPKTCSVGLAVGRQHVARGPYRDPARGSIFDRWAQGGLCCPEKTNVLKRWVREPNRFLDLKLVWQRDRALLGKAYVGHRRPDSLVSARAS